MKTNVIMYSSRASRSRGGCSRAEA